MQVEFDPNKASANLKKHGVSLDEAAGSLLDPFALVREDEDAEGEARFVLVGMSREDRLLTVCYTLREEETIRPEEVPGEQREPRTGLVAESLK